MQMQQMTQLLSSSVGCSRAVARRYLKATNGNVDAATALYFEMGGALDPADGPLKQPKFKWQYTAEKSQYDFECVRFPHPPTNYIGLPQNSTS